MKTSEIKIKGMSCNHCVASIQKALSALEGVKSVDVSLENEMATVEHDEAKTEESIFKNVIDDIGFEAV